MEKKHFEKENIRNIYNTCCGIENNVGACRNEVSHIALKNDANWEFHSIEYQKMKERVYLLTSLLEKQGETIVELKANLERCTFWENLSAAEPEPTTKDNSSQKALLKTAVTMIQNIKKKACETKSKMEEENAKLRQKIHRLSAENRYLRDFKVDSAIQREESATMLIEDLHSQIWRDQTKCKSLEMRVSKDEQVLTEQGGIISELMQLCDSYKSQHSELIESINSTCTPANKLCVPVHTYRYTPDHQFQSYEVLNSFELLDFKTPMNPPFTPAGQSIPSTELQQHTWSLDTLAATPIYELKYPNISNTPVLKTFRNTNTSV